MRIEQDGDSYYITDFENCELQAAKTSPANYRMLVVRNYIAQIGPFDSQKLAATAEKRITEAMPHTNGDSKPSFRQPMGATQHHF